MTYNELMNSLVAGSAVITFFKANGDKRVMLCTRNPAMASAFGSSLGGALSIRDGKMTNGKTMAVIDIEKRDIRAFTFDKIMRVEIFGDLRDSAEYDKAIKYVAETRKSISENKLSAGEFNIL